jgi:putative exporter of polyketide antibiotics
MLAALPLAWLLSQPDGGSVPVEVTLDAAYVQAVRHDPAHQALYGRVYLALGDVTASDQVHYVVHRTAALLALLVGDRAAAQDQENRAAQHAPG